MEDLIRMYRYCAEMRDDCKDDDDEVSRATRLMFDTLARAYAREIEVMAC